MSWQKTEHQDDNDEIYCTNIIDRYASRPNQLTDMCLALFAISSVTRKPSQISDESQHEYDEEDQNNDTIQLQHGLGTKKRRGKKAVLHYHHISQQKHPEEYFYSQLLLFLPWRDDKEELHNVSSYEDHCNSNSQVIAANKAGVEHHGDIIQEALVQNEEFGPPIHAFDSISAQVQQQYGDDDTVPQEFDPNFASLNPDCNMTDVNTSSRLPVSSVVNMALEARPHFVEDSEFSSHVQSLNIQQRDAFAKVAQWCHEKSLSITAGQKVPPLYLFVTGGAGTGKSHLIQAVFQMAIMTFQEAVDGPEEVYVLLTAPTGTAAYNISGTTLHSTFLLPLGQTKSYTKLSDDKLNTMRSMLSNLKLLIIDEISMVGNNLLLQLHYRLFELMASNAPFGGIYILTFGDLYQLPLVKQRFVFQPVSDNIARMYDSLWSNFQFIELTEIMRQRDDQKFAEILKRVRAEIHTAQDIEERKKNEVKQDYPNSILHVYARNKDVDYYNQNKLTSLGTPVESMMAIDKKPKALERFTPSDDPKFTAGLPHEVKLGIGTRVMLVRNVDISDGLVNGSQGTVVTFINRKRTNLQTYAVLVKFDDSHVGKNARKNTQFILELKNYPEATPVLRIEGTFSITTKNKNLNINRYQFPLKLAWACTIHKVQGLTVDKILVSFASRFHNGQAYVALSRAKSVSGLYLKDFQQNKIRASKPVQRHMEHLHSEKKAISFYSTLDKDRLISVLNVRSLPLHRHDVLHDPTFRKSDIIVLTETWLAQSQITSQLLLLYSTICFRCDKAEITSHRTAGGVAVVLKKSYARSVEPVYSFSDRFFQGLIVKTTAHTGDCLYIVAVYRSPNSTGNVEPVLHDMMTNIPDTSKVIITGDFNENLLSQNASFVLKYFEQKGFIQHVRHPTHCSGLCLDHLYTRSVTVTNTIVHSCYFSDHCWVSCNYRCK